MTRRDLWILVATFAGVVAVSVLHNLTPDTAVLYDVIFQRMYVLPVVVAALYLGWRGAVATALFAGLCYIPHVLLRLITQEPVRARSVAQAAEVLDFVIVGVAVGLLVERERKQKKQLELTTQRLNEVYLELQSNFEQMKRTERLSALGQLSAGLAHELRNPLASVDGAAAALQDGSLEPEEQGEFLEIIRKECRRLNRLLTGFLDFARPAPPSPQVVDLDGLLDSVIVLFSAGLNRSCVSVRKSVPKNLPNLECDPEQIKQVLLNLIINADQAMPNGGEICLSADRDGSYAVISVSDEGVGIRPDYRDRIFDPFFTTKDAGTGLGLSAAHQIVSQHAGSISVQERPGGGTTFAVKLPIRNGGFQ